jgi:hypothetical protein
MKCIDVHDVVKCVTHGLRDETKEYTYNSHCSVYTHVSQTHANPNT